jgi:hypothetical protein
MSKIICKYYLDCDFFKRFNVDLSGDDKITMFHEIVDIYCFGKMRDKCVRFMHQEEHGRSIADEIAPNGQRYSPGPGSAAQ